MALYATNRFAGDGTTIQYEINFVGQYIDRSHVKAYRVDNDTQVRTPVAIATGQWLNATTITGFAPTPVGQTLVIYRDTPKPPMVDFVNGSRFTEYNLDLVARQGLFLAMETMDAVSYETLGELPQQLRDLHQALADSVAAAASAIAANEQAQEARTQVITLAADVAEKWANVSAKHLEIVDAHTDVMAAQSLVLADRVAAEAAANWAGIYRTIAQNSATAAAASATDAGVAAATATGIAASLVSGTIGFTDTAYDWGSITDPQTFFNKNYGLITESI